MKFLPLSYDLSSTHHNVLSLLINVTQLGHWRGRRQECGEGVEQRTSQSKRGYPVVLHVWMCHFICCTLFYLFIYFLATTCSLWDPSSLTRDWTCALGSERVLTTGPPENSCCCSLCYKTWNSTYRMNKSTYTVVLKFPRFYTTKVGFLLPCEEKFPLSNLNPFTS